MALQVWLPLNGNLNNQGLSNVTFSGTPAWKTTGKIGSCLNLASKLTCNCTALSGLTEFSITFWTKVNDDTSLSTNWVDIISFTDATSSGATGLLRWETCYASTLVSRGPSWHDNATYATTNQTIISGVLGIGAKNRWEHLTITVGNDVRVYRQGILECVCPVAGGHLTGAFTIGENNNINGEINDLRIYDHALSPKEVKEISKGLVLHYTFTSENIEPPLSIANFSDLTTWNKEGGVTVSWDSTANAYKVLDSSHTSSRWGIWKQVTLKANRSYTFSIYGRQVDQVSGYGFAEGNSWPGIASNFTTTRTQYSKTINVGNQNITCRIYLYVYPVSGGTNYGYFDTPVLTESSYQIYDSSGYGHHGIYNGGANQDVSPRHEQCFHFSDQNHYIKIDNLQTTGFGDSYSFAWWAKISSVTPMHWGFSNGIRVNGMYTGRLWNTGDSSNNPLYNIGTTTQVTAPTVNVWHHWVMTGDGTHCYVYQDGVLWAEAKTYKSISGTTLYINGWSADSSYSSNNYSITDFRIYATALSADDIKELYNTPVFIDNKQNLSAYEFVEDDNAEIRKNGVLEGVTFTEDEEIQIANDGQIQSNSLYEI